MKILKIGDVWKARYGEKVYKLSLTTGCTCPNRDGSKSVGGCIFCSESGSGDFAQTARDIDTQIEQAKKLVEKKGGTKFIAYFQSFTNTYGPVDKLEPLFMQAASHPEVAEISIATRCDCLGDDVLAMLDRLNRIKPVTVELGLQSRKTETLNRINCCYTLQQFDDAVKKLQGIGVHTVAHIILGFPWESEDDMVASAFHVGQLGVNGIKLQLLHVLKGTQMGEDFMLNPFKTLTLEEYCHVLGRCLQALPPDMEIHRLTGDGAKRDLIAPLWSANKRVVMNTINRYIENL